MKPPVFDYHAPETLDEAVRLLAANPEGAKVIAGGQSLMPMLNFRLLEPELLVDIGRIKALQTITAGTDGIRIGAGVTHAKLASSAAVQYALPVIPHTMQYVAHMAIRNRGTIGGSLGHGDPAAELPLLAVLLDAEIQIVGPAGERTARAQDFFLAPLQTDLAEDEIIASVMFPNLPSGAGWGFEETARRAGDFALAGAGAILTIQHGAIVDVRLGVMGVDETPRRLHGLEAQLLGRAWDRETEASTLRQVRAQVNPTTDLQASADYRRHLAGVMAVRALNAAWTKAQDYALETAI